MLVTERSGGLWMITSDGTKQRIYGVPRVVARGRVGLVDVAVSSEFECDQTVFFIYTDSAGLGATRTAVARTFLDQIGASLHDRTDIFVQRDAFVSSRHCGSRIAFVPNGDLFVAFGNRANRPETQNVTNTVGSVIRIQWKTR